MKHELLSPNVKDLCVPIRRGAMKNDGGPAFPSEWNQTWYAGMSLRAWLTGQALKGLIAYPHASNLRTFEQYANNAVSFADATIKELEKE